MEFLCLIQSYLMLRDFDEEFLEELSLVLFLPDYENEACSSRSYNKLYTTHRI